MIEYNDQLNNKKMRTLLYIKEFVDALSLVDLKYVDESDWPVVINNMNMIKNRARFLTEGVFDIYKGDYR